MHRLLCILVLLLAGCASREAHRPAVAALPNLRFYTPSDIVARLRWPPASALETSITRDPSRSRLIVRRYDHPNPPIIFSFTDGHPEPVTSESVLPPSAGTFERQIPSPGVLPKLDLPNGAKWEIPATVARAAIDDSGRYLLTWQNSGYFVAYQLPDTSSPLFTLTDFRSPPQSAFGLKDKLYLVTGEDHERFADLVGQVQAGPRVVHVFQRGESGWAKTLSVELPACDVLDVDPQSDWVLAQSRTFLGWVPPDGTTFQYHRFLYNLSTGRKRDLPTAGGHSLNLPVGFFLTRDPLQKPEP